jgi:GT2 family glycosyltransferase
MQTNPEVAVVAVNYNTRSLLLACLASVVESTASMPLELVVVDNASIDGSVDAVRKDFPQAVVIANQENRGFGAACNQAIRRTAAPLVLLLNSDARLTPQALGALCDRMIQHPRCGAAGCHLTDSSGKGMREYYGIFFPHSTRLWSCLARHTGSSLRSSVEPGSPSFLHISVIARSIGSTGLA